VNNYPVGFCPLPFNGVSAKNNGDMRLCCNTDHDTRDRHVFKKENGETYNSGKDDWNFVRNCSQLKDIRKTMLDGKWHSDCIKCQADESVGTRTLRMQEYDKWKMTPESVKEFVDKDGTLDTEKMPIQYIDVRYGNFCNLKCRMCGPTDSSKWYDDFVKLTGKNSFKDGYDEVVLEKNKKGLWDTNNYDWFESSSVFANNILKYASKAKTLYILGGEPFIIDQHKKDLKAIINLGNSKNIELRYASNLTTLPQDTIDLWTNFKKVSIYASIDGYGDVFNYQRAPANWNTVLENLKRLDEIDNVAGYSQYTTTVFNVFHFPEFYKWWKEESGLKKFIPIPTNCYTPSIYNTQILPKHIKNQIVEYYKKFIIDDRFQQRASGVLNFMNSQDQSDLIPKFLDATKKLDTIRNQNITDIVPQYKELFNV
jgi:organic radical activating enzyme